jgi:hypothetical protein
VAAGHKDGQVRMWDALGEQPQLLLSTPAVEPLASPEGLPPQCASAVTALELVWQHGLLLTGHISREEKRVGQMRMVAGHDTHTH